MRREGTQWNFRQGREVVGRHRIKKPLGKNTGFMKEKWDYRCQDENLISLYNHEACSRGF